MLLKHLGAFFFFSQALSCFPPEVREGEGEGRGEEGDMEDFDDWEEGFFYPELGQAQVEGRDEGGKEEGGGREKLPQPPDEGSQENQQQQQPTGQNGSKKENGVNDEESSSPSRPPKKDLISFGDPSFNLSLTMLTGYYPLSSPISLFLSHPFPTRYPIICPISPFFSLLRLPSGVL